MLLNFMRALSCVFSRSLAKRRPIFRFRHLRVFLFTLGCVACGDRAIKQGVLVDSPVAGVEWRSAERSGVTDAEGKFSYRKGERVTFTIGSVELGSVRGQALITPLTLAAKEDVLAPSVVNRARLLQSLDEDLDPDNGITISSDVRALATVPIDFDQPVADFETDAGVIALYVAAQNGKTATPALVGVEQAVAHLQRTLLAQLGNQKPTISLSGAQRVVSGERVLLWAQASDPDGLVSDFSWRQIVSEGQPVIDLQSIASVVDSAAQANDDNDSNAEITETSFSVFFTAPEVDRGSIDLTFEFTAIDNEQATGSGTTVVTVLHGSG